MIVKDRKYINTVNSNELMENLKKDKNKDKICAIIVTYNRKYLLIKCIDSVIKQTKKINSIIIIDNASTDGTSKFLYINGFLDRYLPKKNGIKWKYEYIYEDKNVSIKMQYVMMDKNSGGAGGFHEGIKIAYKDGYNWFWLMDDDGIAENNCLDRLLVNRRISDFICPLILEDKQNYNLSFKLKFVHENKNKIINNLKDLNIIKDKKYIVNVANPFNGTLISRRLVSKIGLPNKKFFIWGDETEYMLRAMKYRFNIITVLNSYFYHPKQKKEEYSSLVKLGPIFYVNDERLFYIYIRNYSYIESRYKMRSYLQTLIRYSVFFIVQRKFDLKGMMLFLNATSDGLFSKFKEI